MLRNGGGEHRWWELGEEKWEILTWWPEGTQRGRSVYEECTRLYARDLVMRFAPV